jgi:hypothetical protein
VTRPTGSSTAVGGQAALSRGLRDFLIQLSIALHRYAMYPDGHPSLAPTVEHVMGLLDELFHERETLSLGIARNQLVIEGVATDPKNPVLTELASRMHRHHIGAVVLRRGATHPELHEFLHAASQDPDRTGRPVGIDPRFRDEVWPHLRFYPLNYERLRFAGEDASADETETTRATRTRAAQLWLGLARAALASGQTTDARQRNGDDDLENTDPAVVAEAIRAHQRDAAYDQVIVGYMLQIADELKGGQVPESAALKRRVSKLVGDLDQGTLQRLLGMGGDSAQQQRFLLNAAEGMAADAVVQLIQAAAETNAQTVSHSMLRMLQKLARHAESGRGRRQATADASVREQVAKLIANWSLRDPNPDAYRAALERMSSASPVFISSVEARHLPEPRRILEMALETDAMGESVERAADELVSRGELKWLLETVRSAHAPAVTTALRTKYVTPTQLEEILAHDPVQANLLDELLPHLGIEAADPLLDALIAAESSQTRRLLIDRLIKLGPGIGPSLVARLGDDRWYVTRNMLALLGELPSLPPDFNADTYTAHPDGRVRREALRILLRSPATRERAICTGLADRDDHAVRLALTAAARGCPEEAIPLLVTRATTGSNADQRTTALRVLSTTGHPSALETLLRIAAPRRAWLGMKAPPKSREYLAALQALTRHADDPRARNALAVAAKARDPEIAQAAITPPDEALPG